MIYNSFQVATYMMSIAVLFLGIFLFWIGYKGQQNENGSDEK